VVFLNRRRLLVYAKAAYHSYTSDDSYLTAKVRWTSNAQR
jgi:hypothetical protein